MESGPGHELGSESVHGVGSNIKPTLVELEPYFITGGRHRHIDEDDLQLTCEIPWPELWSW